MTGKRGIDIPSRHMASICRQCQDIFCCLLQELHQQKTGDVLDAAADTVQDELNSQLLEVESRELHAIEEAIARMDQGLYGDCDTCGKSIPISRLRAVPYATDCIGCRRKAESQRKSGGAVTWDRVFDNAEMDSV